jgi:hypothetical protein
VKAGAGAGGGGGGAYKPPTYKRLRRVDEDIDRLSVQGIADEKLIAARREVREAAVAAVRPVIVRLTNVTEEEFDRFHKTENFRELRKHARAAIAQQAGGTESFDALIAAFLDRSNLDQTTRLLLTTPLVLEREFFGVMVAGHPAPWDTLAVVETIRHGLEPRAKELYEALVKKYALERGWDDSAQLNIVTKLTTRYASLS